APCWPRARACCGTSSPTGPGSWTPAWSNCPAGSGWTSCGGAARTTSPHPGPRARTCPASRRSSARSANWSAPSRAPRPKCADRSAGLAGRDDHPAEDRDDLIETGSADLPPQPLLDVVHDLAGLDHLVEPQRGRHDQLGPAIGRIGLTDHVTEGL